MPNDEISEEKRVCPWCEKPLTQIEGANSGYSCSYCTRLLIGAGISDEEIYGRYGVEGE